LLAEFWTLVDWPPYLLDLNLLDISVPNAAQESEMDALGSYLIHDVVNQT
jgi:hypothetical protein